MPPAIRTPINPEGINQGALSPHWSQEYAADEERNPAMTRGFTDQPGYAFQDDNISTEYVPEDYGTNPNAQLIGGQDPGVAPVLPPEEYARFDERVEQAKPITVSANDISRMNPKEAAAAIEKQLGARPTFADTEPGLKSKAQIAFNDHYVTNEHREPSAMAWSTFDEQWNKNPQIRQKVKDLQGEWDTKYKKLETQTSDTREREKVINDRFKDTSRKGMEYLATMTDPEKQKTAKLRFMKGIVEAKKNPETQEEENAFLLADLVGPKQEKKSVYDLEPEEITVQAESVASGRRAPKTISARRERGQILTEVSRKYPKYDFSKSDANYNYMNNAVIIRSAGMVQAAMPRVYDLHKKSLELQNLTDVPILDQTINKIRRAVGSEAVVDFESLRNAVLMEVNAALSGTSVASDYRIKLELENLGSGMTIGQQTKSIDNLISALEARSEAAQMILYPWDVVRGERTMKEWKTDQKEEAASVKNMIFGNKKTVAERRRTADGRTLVKYTDGTMGEE